MRIERVGKERGLRDGGISLENSCCYKYDDVIVQIEQNRKCHATEMNDNTHIIKQTQNFFPPLRLLPSFIFPI